MVPGLLKRQANDENEIVDAATYVDQGNLHVSLITRLPDLVAQGMVDALAQRVRDAHADPTQTVPGPDGLRRAQIFEEGHVFMVASQKPHFPPNIYLMDFFDVTERQICSRPHDHTGLRQVFIFTGATTPLNITSLSRIFMYDCDLPYLVDEMPNLSVVRSRHTVTVPPCHIVAVQIPIGVSHQFNAFGPDAVILSVHIEEQTEVDRERMETSNMMAQTRFLTDTHPDLSQCGSPSGS